MTAMPSSITRALWWCAGVDAVTLAGCPPAEWSKFTGIGGTVLCTGLLAGLSGGYAFYTIFGSAWLAAPLGLLWGGMIFNLDRYLVSTLHRTGGLARQVLIALPRLLLAAALAVVIAKPLELRIFEAEIEEVLTERAEARGEAAGAKFGRESSEIQAEVATLRERLSNADQRRQTDYEAYRCECDGTCGTGQKGRGSECERKGRKYEKSNGEYEQLAPTINRRLEELSQRRDEIAHQSAAAATRATNETARGLLARLEASRELPPTPGYALMLVLLFLEIAPIVAKLLAPAGPYERAVALRNAAYLQTQEQAFEQAQAQRTATAEQRREQARIRQETETRHQAKTHRALTQAKFERVQGQIDAWLDEEARRLN